MPSYSRFRERKLGLTVGGKMTRTYLRGSGGTKVTTKGFEYNRDYKKCNDSVSTLPYPDQGCHIFSRTGSSLHVNGEWHNAVYHYEYENFCPVTFDDDSSTSHVSSADPSLALLKTLCWSKTNPASDPDVDILNFIWELKEFPSMLRHAGRLFAKGQIPDLASAPIAVQFGWKPLLNDLRTLLGVAEAINKKLKQLKAFSKEEKATRHLGNWDGSASSTYNFGGISYVRNRETKTRAWAVIKHSLLTDRVPVWDYDDASSLAYSTTLSAATIWNSFPWTWLIDYLLGVGLYLEATRGMIPFKIDKANIMVNLHTIVKYEGIPKGSTKFSNGSVTVESKIRHISVNPQPSIAWHPGISSGQLSNLGLLLLAKAFGSEQVGRR